MHLRALVARVLLTALIAATALASVGLTAPPDGVFTIAVRPTLLRLDPAAIEQSRARVLAFDIDIKLGSIHLHAGWPGLAF